MCHSDPSLVMSAYVDDINVFVRDERDVALLVDSLELFQRASSAKVNWGKSEFVGWAVGRQVDSEVTMKPQLEAAGLEGLGGFSGNGGGSEEELGGCYGESVCLTV